MMENKSLMLLGLALICFGGALGNASLYVRLSWRDVAAIVVANAGWYCIGIYRGRQSVPYTPPISD